MWHFLPSPFAFCYPVANKRCSCVNSVYYESCSLPHGAPGLTFFSCWFIFFLRKDLTRLEFPHDREWRDAFHVWEAPWGAGWVAVDGWTEAASKCMGSAVGAGWWLLLTVVVNSEIVGKMCEVACDVSSRFCGVTRFCGKTATWSSTQCDWIHLHHVKNVFEYICIMARCTLDESQGVC